MLRRAVGGDRVRSLALAGAFFVAAMGGMAAHAQAQTPLDGVVAGGAEAIEKAPGEAEALLAGKQGPLTTASNVLCPPVSRTGELLRELGDEPLGGIGAGLTSLVCSAGLLEFHFHTRWVAPNGETVTRTTVAVVGAATPLDVDDDSGADLIGTITLPAGDEVALVVERVSGETAQLPVSVEAVLTDVEKRVIGREHMAFGYDAREDRAPGRFELSTPTDTLLRPQGEYRFDIAQQDRGERIALTGALFDGEIEDRADPSEVRIDYGASPDNALVRARTGDGMNLTLATDRPGPADISGRVVEGASEDSVEIELRDLPSELSLGLDGETGRVSYDASAPMERLNARIDTAQPTFLNARHFDATLQELPQSFELAVGRGSNDFSLSTDETIGQIDLKARSADRDFPALPDGEAGAIVDATGGGLGLALRVFDLRRIAASFDPVTFEAEMGGGRVFTIDAALEDGDGVTEADLVLDKLPSQVALTVDSATGKVTYAASERMDRLQAVIKTAQPIFLGAGNIEATLLDVPEAFELSVGQEVSNFSLTADQPIGQIDLRARSANRAFPDVPAGQAGVIFDATGGELGLALRVFDLRLLSATLDPLQLEAEMQGGRVFTIDAKLDQADGQGNPLPPVHAAALIDKLPSSVSLGIEDLPASSGGSRLKLTGSAPIGFLRLATEGLELLPGADKVQLEINDLPTQLTVDLPEQGQLATLSASDYIGQLRLVASDGSGTLPANTVSGSANDLFRFRDQPGNFSISARLTALRQLGVNLDPVNLTLQQNPAKTRPVNLDAAFNGADGPVAVTGLLNKPAASTSLSVELEPNQPTKLIFNNSANMTRFELNATGLGSVDSLSASFDNLARRQSICLDTGPLCQRSNPHSVQRRSPTLVSLDFEDFGTQLTNQFTTFNAVVDLGSGDPVRVTNLRFRNLGLDFANDGSTFSCLGNSVPRISMFFDSRNQQFVMNSIKFPPTIVDFQIGTDAQPAKANNRIVRLNGANTFLGVCTGFNSSSAGTMDCGGRKVLTVKLGILGNVNILNFLGFQLLPVCS